MRKIKPRPARRIKKGRLAPVEDRKPGRLSFNFPWHNTVIGTAGHIDHGKTLLVKALTGTDTDRAPEEKARGITIELGFAFLGEEATIVDVPGHERFVKTMVAGVSAIDVALLVIAADDGVMPQSREHLDVLELLGVRRGIVVVNKVDLVDEDWLQLVEEEIAELVAGTFLEGAEVARGLRPHGSRDRGAAAGPGEADCRHR